MSNGKGGGGGFVAGLLVGVMVGGAAAILLSQEEMRDLLVGKAREAGNFAMDASGDLRGKVNDLGDKVGEATSQWQTSATDLYARGKDIVDSARANFGDAVDEGKSSAKKMRDDLGSRTDA
jgi:gas vesicle protein